MEQSEYDKVITDIQRKQRNSAFLYAIIPIGIVVVCLLYFGHELNTKLNELSKVKEQLSVVNQQVEQKENEFKSLITKKQELEGELMSTFGLPIDSIMQLSNKDIIINNSIKAHKQIQKLSKSHIPNSNITVRYYVKSIDDEKLLFSLHELGYRYEKRPASSLMENYVSDCIWYGKNVNIEDVKIVALALIRAGIQIRSIRPFENPNPNYKANIIDIGASIDVPDDAPALSINQVLTAKQFNRN